MLSVSGVGFPDDNTANNYNYNYNYNSSSSSSSSNSGGGGSGSWRREGGRDGDGWGRGAVGYRSAYPPPPPPQQQQPQQQGISPSSGARRDVSGNANMPGIAGTRAPRSPEKNTDSRAAAAAAAAAAATGAGADADAEDMEGAAGGDGEAAYWSLYEASPRKPGDAAGVRGRR